MEAGRPGVRAMEPNTTTATGNLAFGTTSDKARMVDPTTTVNLGNIHWEECNYPALLKLVHYVEDELPEPQKSWCKKLNYCLVLTFLATSVGFLNAILQTAGVPDYHWSNIVYAICNIILCNPPSLFVFNLGVRAVCGAGSGTWYKIAQGFLCLAWFVFGVFHIRAINGVIRCVTLLTAGYSTQALGILLEALLYLIDAGLGGYCVFKLQDFE